MCMRPYFVITWPWPVWSTLQSRAWYLCKKRRVVTDAELVEPLALCVDVHLSHVGVLQWRMHNNRMYIEGSIPLPQTVGQQMTGNILRLHKRNTASMPASFWQLRIYPSHLLSMTNGAQWSLHLFICLCVGLSLCLSWEFMKLDYM